MNDPAGGAVPGDDRFDVRPVRWVAGLELIDQRLLPGEATWVRATTTAQVVTAIADLVVRGAPAIGIAAAYGMATAAFEADVPDSAPASALGPHLHDAAASLGAARPTAVNLAWAVRKQLATFDELVEAGEDAGTVRRRLLEGGRSVENGEREACRALGDFGVSFVPDRPPGARANVLTHCNAGALATGGWGSALGVVRSAVAAGRSLHVWVDETRPVLQGARLTAWELTRAGIPNTLIVDGAAASIMARGDVDVCVVGADRVAANGDVANKIGTYGVALAAQAHGIPFLVAAPVSTIDLACTDGASIEIEERSASEVIRPSRTGDPIAPGGQAVANPAFDVTPASFVTAIVTERGIAEAPYEASLRRLCDEP